MNCKQTITTPSDAFIKAIVCCPNVIDATYKNKKTDTTKVHFIFSDGRAKFKSIFFHVHRDTEQTALAAILNNRVFMR